MTIKEYNEINSIAITSNSKKCSITYQDIWNTVIFYFSYTQGSLSRSVDPSGICDIFSGAHEFFWRLIFWIFYVYDTLKNSSLFYFIWMTKLWTIKWQVIIYNRNVQPFSELINLSRSSILMWKRQIVTQTQKNL